MILSPSHHAKSKAAGLVLCVRVATQEQSRRTDFETHKIPYHLHNLWAAAAAAAAAHNHYHHRDHSYF